MGKKYKIRATSMVVYYGYIDSDNHPEYFDENGDPKTPYEIDKDGLVNRVNNPDFDLYDRTFDYGVKPIAEDWEFTDYEQVSEQDYISGTKEQEKLN